MRVLYYEAQHAYRAHADAHGRAPVLLRGGGLWLHCGTAQQPEVAHPRAAWQNNTVKYIKIVFRAPPQSLCMRGFFPSASASSSTDFKTTEPSLNSSSPLPT